MRHTSRYIGTAMGVAMVLAMSSGPATAGVIVFEASGANAAAVQPTVDVYRSGLGALNPNNGMAFASGRREINWDGVPDAFADPNPFPGDFFASTVSVGRMRGAQFNTPGTGFLVSADSSNPTATPIAFGYPLDFIPFSAERLFSPVGSNVTDVTFFVPGTLTPGTVTGFGAIFSDVEVAGSTRIEAFDVNGVSLFSRNVLTSGNAGLSFLGFIFDAGERAARVRLTSGSAVLLGNGNFGVGDAVVMDDFIYAEPQAQRAVPEPSSLALAGLGAAAEAVRRRRRRLT